MTCGSTFRPAQGFQSIPVAVEYDGTLDTSDARSTDPNEFWPTLYQRAYRAVETAYNLDVATDGRSGRPLGKWCNEHAGIHGDRPLECNGQTA